MKTNKQGVRDLNHLGKVPVPDFGKNQMPGELAAKILTEAHEKVVAFGPPLTPEVQEFLTILAEECGEVTQRATKILRFGLRPNPWTGKDNSASLEYEIADLCAVFDVLLVLGVIDAARVQALTKAKVQAFLSEVDPSRPRLKHMTPDLREKLQRYLEIVYAGI